MLPTYKHTFHACFKCGLNVQHRLAAGSYIRLIQVYSWNVSRYIVNMLIQYDLPTKKTPNNIHECSMANSNKKVEKSSILLSGDERNYRYR